MNIVITIQTSYSEEKYFIPNVDKNNIEIEIFNVLAGIVCDAYEILNYKEVDQNYISARNKAIAEYEKLFNEKVENDFLQGKYTTLEVISEAIKNGK